MSDDEASKGAEPRTLGTVGVQGTVPQVTSTDNEHISEFTGHLPIGASAARIGMVPTTEVPNRPFLRPDQFPLASLTRVHFVSSSTKLHFTTSSCYGGLRLDQRLPLVLIQKTEALGEKG